MAEPTKYEIGKKEYTIDQLYELFNEIDTKLDKELSVDEASKVCNQHIKLMKALLDNDLVLTKELIHFRDKLASIADKVSRNLNKAFSEVYSKRKGAN